LRTDACDRCGAVLRVGDYPFCKGRPHDHQHPTYRNIPDAVPGGFTVENAWSEPRTFYSQREYERALAADGMQLAPRWVEGSKHLTRWATIDPYTLESARILCERQAQTRATRDEAEPLQTFTRLPVTAWEGEE